MGDPGSLASLLGAEPSGEATRFRFGRDLHGAFDGAFGGVTAAAALRAARRLAPDRRPVWIDCSFLRAIPAGEVTAVPEVVREGRTVTVVAVQVDDDRGRLSAAVVVGFVDPDALHPLDDAGMVRPGASVRYAEASPWQLRKVDAPVVGTFEPRVALTDPGLVATVLRTPFEEPDSCAESACVVADMAVGPPVARELGDSWVPHPNPNLSLRFAGHESGPEMAGVARLERVGTGVATVRVEVFSGVNLVAVGITSSLLLGLGVMRSPESRR